MPKPKLVDKPSAPEKEAKDVTRPFLRTTHDLLRRAIADHEREVARILTLDAQDQRIPEGAAVDLSSGHWVLSE